MRPVPCAAIAVVFSSFATGQSYEWRQSPINGRLYAVTQPTTWSQARVLAQAAGGDLVTVRGADEQAWLVHQFVDSQCLWIGYTDAALEGAWRWVSGSTATFTAWAPGQPDNLGGAEDHAALSPRAGWPLGADGQWRDMPATFACPGIIELDAAVVGRTRALGSGCPGSGGTPTLTALLPAPVPGSQLPLRFGSLPSVPTALIAGLGLPRPMPLPLDGFGMPGCSWWGNNVAVFLLANTGSTGSFQWALSIPSSPQAIGIAVRLQAAVVDPPANAAGLTVTNALAMVYGAGIGEVAYDEPFGDETMLARELSGGSWSGGVASFARIGGDGRHGTFDPAVLGIYEGNFGGKDTWVIDTDDTTIPASRTLTGNAIVVTDGHFCFDELVVASDVRVRFVGQSPPVVAVAGRIAVHGEIDVQGESNDYPTTFPPTGQPGAAGGPFGGRGGQGGDKGLGVGALPVHNGQDGEDAAVLAARAYGSSVVGTGGRGSVQYPLNGLASSLFYVQSPVSLSYTPTASAGGGGGGLATRGQDGVVAFNNHVDPVTGVPPLLSALGPLASGGSAVQFLPFPAPTGATESSVHFLVGGSGGGGAATNAALSIDVLPASARFARGAGGAGGGGALGLRAGHTLTVDSAAALRANGGSTGGITAATGGATPAPGGAGSGGSLVLQTDDVANIAGLVDVRGGAGGTYDRTSGTTPPPVGARVVIQGGDGGPGFVRLETAAGATPTMLPNMMPAATADNVGQLAETDALASCTSRVFDTRVRAPQLPPRFLRYEIDARIDGVRVRFSDDPAVATLAADIGAPVQIWFRGALPSQPGMPLPWRTSVRTRGALAGLDADGAVAFQYRLVADRALANSIVVERVRVVYRL